MTSNLPMPVQRGSDGAAQPSTMTAPVPQQLKRPPARFTNRAGELERLDTVLAGSTGDQPTVLVLSGLGGIGKTALALRWLHGLRGSFPGGQLQANLGAFDPTGPAAVGEVLGQFLRALGVPRSRVPIDPEEQGGLYRTFTAETPLLVLLDNAESESQVRPLIPSAPGSLVVVTSRRPLGGLAVDEGAHLLGLEPLTAEHGVALLRTALGDRVDTERAHATTIVRLTAGLPIALCSVAARLAAKPRASLERMATDLGIGKKRLAVLSARNEEDSVQATFDLAYQALPPEAARLYRLLGLHPGAEISAGAAAAAINETVGRTLPLLEELVEVSMLTAPEDDRYVFHDLHRLHAVEKAEQNDSGDEREAAQLRILEWYLRAARSTAHLVPLDEDPIPYEFTQRKPDRASLPEPEDALGWLESERTNLYSAMQAAAQLGLPELAWHLGDAMWPLFLLHKHYRDFLTVSQLGAKCAREWGHAYAETLMLNRCGAACRGAGRFDEAVEYYGAALRSLPADGAQLAAIRSVEGLGLVALAQGRLDDALREFGEDLRRSRELERQHDVALAMVNLGVTLTRQERVGEAIEHLEEARRILADEGDGYNVARARIDLARALAISGKVTEAREHATEARTILHERGSAFEEARAMQVLAEVADLAGDAAEAQRRYTEVLPIFTELGRPEAKEVKERLRASETPS